MDSILVCPKNSNELKLISEFFNKMNIKSTLLSLEDKEDLYFGKLINIADRTKKVNREEVMLKLN